MYVNIENAENEAAPEIPLPTPPQADEGIVTPEPEPGLVPTPVEAVLVEEAATEGLPSCVQ